MPLTAIRAPIVRPLAFVVTALLSTWTATALGTVHDPCAAPPEVSKWLKAQSGWRLVRASDLEMDDQQIWRRARPGLCPGLAQARLDGVAVSYGLVLLKQGARGMTEMDLILLRRGDRLLPVLQRPLRPVENPRVVWTASPGPSHAWDNDRVVAVLHESIVFEQLEAWSIQVYMQRGHLVNLVTSN